ncbi:unnamed protein product [Parascedosporium putredinis]|uniref:FAD-binding PCMH-type domain-containing protein n=1 Tax=Parascedosporium putredinis TaxID=1442378 RepID=A0A9P1GX50_9PEZI|nr:unnamed protein product [Parascedosporium putredinis]CAI7989365.1 unnamed protein product [Parascedosporium putredinis]
MRHPIIASSGLLALLLPTAVSSARSCSAPLTKCLEAAGVPLDKPGSEAWEMDAAPFNERLPFLPAAVAVPRTTAHIEDAVKCAAELGVKVSAKCGGHSYASLGLGGEDGHLVVAMDRMHAVTLAEDGETAVVQEARGWGMWRWSFGSRERGRFRMGRVLGTVGISGHALHGGFGMSSYTHGLALDWIRSATVVLANGTTVRASADENADLFWALRGAGGSMGIVAEYEFATFEPVEEYTHFEAALNWADGESLVGGWMSLQAWGAEEMPREMNLRFSVDSRGVLLDGLYHGSQADMEAVVLPLLERLGGGAITVNTTFDWMGQLEQYAFAEELNYTHPYNLHETFYAKSLFTHALPPEAIASFITYALTTGTEFYNTEVDHDSTAYAHRDKLLLFQFYDRAFGAYPSGEEPFGLLDGFVSSITDHLAPEDWGMYLNYADPRMEDVAEERAALGPVTSQLLRPSLKSPFRITDPPSSSTYRQSIEGVGGSAVDVSSAEEDDSVVDDGSSVMVDTADDTSVEMSVEEPVEADEPPVSVELTEVEELASLEAPDVGEPLSDAELLSLAEMEDCDWVTVLKLELVDRSWRGLGRWGR